MPPLPEEERNKLLELVRNDTEWWQGFLEVWSAHENAPRMTCEECYFESSEGYDESHAPGCSRRLDGN